MKRPEPVREYMSKAESRWWQSTLRELLVGQEVTTVSCHEANGYRPEVRLDRVNEVRRYNHDDGKSFITIDTEHGIWCNITSIQIKADERTVVIENYSDSRHHMWWTFTLRNQDVESWRLFSKRHDEALRLHNGRQLGFHLVPA